MWLPVTVRVAWELLAAGVRVRPDLLRDAREHVLRCLPAGVGLDESEQLASMYTRDLLVRTREHKYRRPALDADIDIAVPRWWREQLSQATDHIADAVLRLHFGDGLPMDRVERQVAIDRTVLGAAREGLREAMRVIAADDGVDLKDWSDARLDRLLTRVANTAATGCPGPMGLLSDAGRVHADVCPRCSRAVRLIRGGVLSPADLFPPEGGPPVPAGEIGLLALMLHPDARSHRARLEQSLAGSAIPAGPDVWLVADTDIGQVGEALAHLASQGTPARHHLRGALVRGAGRWSGDVVLGPLPIAALDAGRSRTWAEVQGISELPVPLPPPPRATRWWLATGAIGLLAALAGAWTLVPLRPDPDTPIEATVKAEAQGWSVRFDTDDMAVVDVLLLEGGQLRRISQSSRTEKGAWATGEGDYQLDLAGDGFALLSSLRPVQDLDALAAAARASTRPLDFVADELARRRPDVAVVLSPVPDEEVHSP